MKKHLLSTVINFCSNESRFIQATIEQASLFSRQVIVVVCDHFFDGSPENRALLDEVYAAFPDCLFLEYPFIPQKIPKKIWKKITPAHFWHSLSRLVGYCYLDEEIETVLFLDADEIPDGKRFANWLNNSDYMQHTTLKLSNYWYFRDSSNQALRFEDSIVLAQRRALDLQILLHQEERDAIYNLLPGPKRRHVTDEEGSPMFHHYSWVRTQEEMLKKVQAWGHKGDRNWTDLVKEEFASPFKGSDFTHGYTYRSVKPFFDISLEKPPSFTPKQPPQVKKLGKKELFRFMKLRNFWNFLDF
jgi:hypothetical protein